MSESIMVETSFQSIQTADVDKALEYLLAHTINTLDI